MQTVVYIFFKKNFPKNKYYGIEINKDQLKSEKTYQLLRYPWNIEKNYLKG